LQKAAPKHYTICDMSFAQYMVLKKGQLPLYLFTLQQKGLYFTHDTQKF